MHSVVDVPPVPYAFTATVPPGVPVNCGATVAEIRLVTVSLPEVIDALDTTRVSVVEAFVTLSDWPADTDPEEK